MPPSNTNTEIALLKQETQYVKETVTRVEKNTTEWMARLEKKQDEQHKLLYDMVKEMKDSLPETLKNFATKSDHEQNSKRIDELESDKKSVIRWIVGSSLTIILAWMAAIKTFL